MVKKMPADKSLGRDGFNATFLKACWDIVAPDFYRLIDDFHKGTVNIQSINYSFIALIPKKNLQHTPMASGPFHSSIAP